MNKAEQKARIVYNFNRDMYKYNRSNLTPLRLVNIAIQQDRLYKVINARADRKLIK